MNIVCKLSEADDFVIDSHFIEYNVNNSGQYTYTFWSKESIKKLINLPNFISNIGLDFLYISLFVFGADRISDRNSTYDSWTRVYNLYIPVLELDKWNNNKELLEQMLNYLSGDKWNIIFRSREYTQMEIRAREKYKKRSVEKELDVKKICMFSGGLDSFIGAIDALEECCDNVLFVSHYGGGKGVKEYQDLLKAKLYKKYTVNEDQFFSFHAAARDGKEDTTRTRSFMFFCHAIALATSINTSIELLIPENGLISLNIPLTNSRLGSSSTRTTHPYYLDMLQTLIQKLGLSISIRNPYQFKTKGEMILECKNMNFLKRNISNTMSCSHPDHGRMLGEKEACHCGNCLPCVIRRAAILKSGFKDYTVYRDIDFKSGETAKVNFNSYMLGLNKYQEKTAFLSVQKSGPIKADIDKYAQIYIRGMEELGEVLNRIK
ncbi:Qat anti-phage system QueC-like protein QatC [Paenibacillus donghaensis]|uniref:ATPase n=1 Tax=Paenibacillus donghaensis TaxID=414771 RepID=A0A2Z2KS49_9BACL|nr:Qat anti-phage system QueC-like protein QatC [Paenibacillus donghaensis]ASA23371.1 ATPase [Paenibacillus donghaensis]